MRLIIIKFASIYFRILPHISHVAYALQSYTKMHARDFCFQCALARKLARMRSFSFLNPTINSSTTRACASLFCIYIIHIAMCLVVLHMNSPTRWKKRKKIKIISHSVRLDRECLYKCRGKVWGNIKRDKHTETFSSCVCVCVENRIVLYLFYTHCIQMHTNAEHKQSKLSPIKGKRGSCVAVRAPQCKLNFFECGFFSVVYLSINVFSSVIITYLSNWTRAAALTI